MLCECELTALKTPAVLHHYFIDSYHSGPYWERLNATIIVYYTIYF